MIFTLPVPSTSIIRISKPTFTPLRRYQLLRVGFQDTSNRAIQSMSTIRTSAVISMLLGLYHFPQPGLVGPSSQTNQSIWMGRVSRRSAFGWIRRHGRFGRQQQSRVRRIGRHQRWRRWRRCLRNRGYFGFGRVDWGDLESDGTIEIDGEGVGGDVCAVNDVTITDSTIEGTRQASLARLPRRRAGLGTEQSEAGGTCVAFQA